MRNDVKDLRPPEVTCVVVACQRPAARCGGPSALGDQCRSPASAVKFHGALVAAVASLRGVDDRGGREPGIDGPPGLCGPVSDERPQWAGLRHVTQRPKALRYSGSLAMHGPADVVG